MDWDRKMEPDWRNTKEMKIVEQVKIIKTKKQLIVKKLYIK